MPPSPGLQTAGGAISPSLSSSASRLSSSARLLVSEPDPVVSILLLPHSQITKDPDQGLPTLPEDISPALEKAVRTVKYTFPRRFLRFDTIRTALVFAVGDEPVSNFRMIERHYFKDELVRSYDFNFGFCIPGSTNSWEAIYDLPEISPEREKEMIDSPFATKRDSFYFVGDALVMHNKAEYQYKD